MYNLPEVNQVTYASSYGNGSIQGFANGKVNYLNWSNSVSGSISNITPSPNSPLVVRVPSGTTTINDPFAGFLNGKSDPSGPSTSVLWDLSQVTGTVTFNNFQGGAIYAPNANLALNIQFSVNSQILGKDITVTSSSDGEEVHQLNFLPNLPCGQTAPTITPVTGALSLTKQVDGATASSAYANKFSFTLSQQSGDTTGVTLPSPATVTNDANGTVQFGNIKYSKAGTYVFKVTEAPSGSFTSSPGTLYAQVVVAGPDSSGKLSITSTKWSTSSTDFSKPLTNPVINNVSAPVSAGLSLTKQVDGKQPGSIYNRKFSFTLSIVSGDTSSFTLPPTLTVTNDANGTVQFGNITYSKAGTYVFKVAEGTATGFTPQPAGTLYAQVVVAGPDSSGKLSITSTKWSTSTDFSNPLSNATINNVPILTNLPLTGGAGISAWGLPIFIGVALMTGAGVATRKGKGALMPR
jgi:hypothetical protein